MIKIWLIYIIVFLLKESSTLSLDFTVNYIIDEKIELCFIINLSHNRHVEIHIRILGINIMKRIPASLLSGHTNKIHFEDVYIGCKDPLIQVYIL